MSISRRLLLSAALAVLGVALSCSATANAQDLADRHLDLAIRRSALWEYWAARQQEQVDAARYRSPAQFGQHGSRYGTQNSLGYRTVGTAVGPRQFYGPSLPTSSGYHDAAYETCIGPFGIECSPLDCDCYGFDNCY